MFNLNYVALMDFTSNVDLTILLQLLIVARVFDKIINDAYIIESHMSSILLYHGLGIRPHMTL